MSELTGRLAEVEAEILSRWPESQLVPTLSRIRAVTELMGDPQSAYPIVHVTGTNGKTSTTRFAERLLREHGLKTGRFISPHLQDVRERLAINGDMATPEQFVAAFDDVIELVRLVDARSAESGQPPMTYFEVITAMAFALFADAPVDVAVIEVGLGGAWDATNVGDGQVAVVAPIDLDHTRLLGSTIAEIAGEKAGIIKPGATLVMATQPDEAREVLLARAEEVGATVLEEGRDFEVVSAETTGTGQMLTLRGTAGEYRDVYLPMLGAHQAQNAALALVATEVMMGRALDMSVVTDAFADVTSPGRLEVVRTSPLVLIDGAHNPAAARALATALEVSFPTSSVIGVLAMFADKDVDTVLEILEPVLTEVVVSRSSSHRAMAVEELAERAGEVFGEHRVFAARTLADAVEIAVARADEAGMDSVVLATGSLTTAGEVRTLLKGHGS